MNDRAVAQKRLNENSFDLEAMCMLNRAQEQVSWGLSAQQHFGELEENQCFPFMAADFSHLFKFGKPSYGSVFQSSALVLHFLTLSFAELLCVFHVFAQVTPKDSFKFIFL